VNEKITALVVTHDDRKTDALRLAFSEIPGFDVVVESAKFTDCVARMRQLSADVAIIFLEEQPGGGTVILQAMKKTRENVFAFAVSSERSAEVIVKAIRAGADELVSETPTAEELLKALVKICERRRVNGIVDAGGQVFTVHAPHQGVGSTTLAVNLAAEIHDATGKDVVLVDLDLQRADASVYLNFEPEYSILDVCQSVDTLDNSFLEAATHVHEIGIRVLAAPTNIEDSEAVGAADLESVLNMLRQMYPYIVLDTSSHLNEVSLVALEHGDKVFLLTDNMVASVRGVQRLLDTLERLGLDTKRFQVLLNKPVSCSEVNEKDIKDALKRDVGYRLPFDDQTAVSAANQGVPLGKANARSPLAEAIRAIACLLVGVEGAKKEAKSLFMRLF
jgi:pilus assembly protein CpaE